jgi:hypothetical protein
VVGGGWNVVAVWYSAGTGVWVMVVVVCVGGMDVDADVDSGVGADMDTSSTCGSMGRGVICVGGIFGGSGVFVVVGVSWCRSLSKFLTECALLVYLTRSYFLGVDQIRWCS